MMKRLENIKKTPQADFFLQCFYTMVLSSIDCMMNLLLSNIHRTNGTATMSSKK